MESPVWVRVPWKNKDNLPEKLLNVQRVSISPNWWKNVKREPKWTGVITARFELLVQKKKKIKKWSFGIVQKARVFTRFIIKTRSGPSSHLSGRRSRSCCIEGRQGRNSSRRLASSFWEAGARFSFISAQSLLSCGDLHSSLTLQRLPHCHTSYFNAEVWFSTIAELYENTCGG